VRLHERAREQARASDALLARGEGGPLCGVPVTVKDTQYIAGVETTSGSRTRIGYVPAETCAPVERLEDAGAVVFAKTTTPEFCYFGVTESELHGPTRNPWDLDRTPGGSSGGAGAAVAAGIGPLSLGGDGGGSIRSPAAFCGTVGFKPTFGAVPREPSSPGWKSLVSVGPLARTVADARLMFTAIAGWDARDRHSIDLPRLSSPAIPPAKLRVAVSDDLGFAPVDEDVRKAFWSAAETFARAGVDVIEAHPGLASSVWIWSAIATADARWAEAAEYEHQRGLLAPHTIEFLTWGEQVGAGEYVRAHFERERLARTYADFFARTGVTLLLTPTLGCEAFPLGQFHPDAIGGVPITSPCLDWAGFLYDANLAGLPALALPMGLGDDGLPVSLQLLGARCNDAAVLAAAETLETILGFDARPAITRPEQPTPDATGSLLE
jgi:Asp-tRNA(Asn)/Glu-tRNA(Gln) amidotransferase A subunit family amidase